MIKPSRIIFVGEKSKKAFEGLGKSNKGEDKELHVWLTHAFMALEENAFCGIQIPKRLIPRQYKKYDIENLWKYNLPNGWRLLYSVKGSDLIVLSIIIEWLSHKEYERRFKY